MNINLFMNAYQQPENKLTYNFLSMVNIIKKRDFLEWLSNERLSNDPLVDIKTVFGGGNSNPDGSIILKNIDNIDFNIYLETKTFRRGISIDQLLLHLDWLNGKDKLLVITPRASDKKIIEKINNPFILFKTWSEIVGYLKDNVDNIIVDQFIEYGKLSGEFDEYGEISEDEIKIFVENIKLKFDDKITTIFRDFSSLYDFKLMGLNRIESIYHDNFGRRGAELNYENDFTTFNQWWAISYYYHTNDHYINFKNNTPEIVFFFDIYPGKIELLKFDKIFINILEKLVTVGFESNLNGELTTNRWRLLLYRKSIEDFNCINVNELCKFTDRVIVLLKDSGAFEHKYFNEFI